MNALARTCPSCGADMEVRAIRGSDPATQVEHLECPPCGFQAQSPPGAALALSLIVDELDVPVGHRLTA